MSIEYSDLLECCKYALMHLKDMGFNSNETGLLKTMEELIKKAEA